jgi:hypothetical protein
MEYENKKCSLKFKKYKWNVQDVPELTKLKPKQKELNI